MQLGRTEIEVKYTKFKFELREAEADENIVYEKISPLKKSQRLMNFIRERRRSELNNDRERKAKSIP